MKSRVSVRDIRDARVALKLAGKKICVTNISAHVDETPRKLSIRFSWSLAWLAEEIGLERGCRWNTKAIHNLYLTTARYIVENGGVPSTRSLSRALKKQESTVYTYLRSHKKLAKRIGLVSNEFERYHVAYRSLVRAGAALNRKTLMTMAGVSRDTLARFLKRNPGFLEDYPLTEDKRWVKRRKNTSAATS